MSSRHLVDPELGPLVDALPPMDVTSETLPLIRAITFPERPLPDDGVTVETRMIPGPVGAPDIRVLIYRPANLPADAPALLHIHGGGYVFGTPDISALDNRACAVACRCLVVATSYRLAPETRWPGALEDIYATLCWMDENAATLGIDRNLIAVSGESAGGGHAAALAIRIRDSAPKDGPKLMFQLLAYPMLDDRTPSHPVAGEFIWPHSSNVFGWTSLLGVPAGSDAVPAAAVPARTADLSGLPPAYIAVGALDLFIDENIDYARRLIAAGVPTGLHVLPGAWHGFPGFAPDAAVSKQFVAGSHSALSNAFRQAAQTFAPALQPA